MYRVDRNDFYDNEKNATVYTPPGVSEFLFGILHGHIDQCGVVLDPCVGAGSLLLPFRSAGYQTQGIDVDDQGYPGTIVRDFISMRSGEIDKPALVIANPPFNIDAKTKDLVASSGFGRRPLLPEVWLHKAVTLWGREIPIVLFAPYGLRLNQSVTSRRWRMFTDGKYPPISSIVALPKDVYPNVLFHSEVLIFNVRGLQGHYFYDG
ncbi:MAG: hypothetical protein OXJ62_14115 [Spirochaetaceae bacterium]|nr:hypothetical protein [Spirochaetaceae bacterium]